MYRIPNWEKFQHYKQRNPPWIKLPQDIIDDYAFSAMPSASKAHLLLLWLAAARCDNRFPADDVWLSHRTACPDFRIAPLLEVGFVVEIKEGR
jgi:hypothetical protein